MSSLLEFNPKSTFHKICPGCGKPHVVKNRGREYCSEKCYQDYYNTFRKHIQSFKFNEEQTSDVELLKEYKQPDRNNNKGSVERNIEILKKRMLEKEQITESIESLTNEGFDFKAYSFHYPLDKLNKSFCVEFGPFETFLIGPSIICIRIKNPSNDNLH